MSSTGHTLLAYWEPFGRGASAARWAGLECPAMSRVEETITLNYPEPEPPAGDATANFEPASGQKRRDIVFGLTVFVGAFLLFQVQLILGKYFLPWFGGMPSVWATCLVFFQLSLLGGYAYANFAALRLAPRRQSILHGALLTGSLALLIVLAHFWSTPITPGSAWKPHDDSNPTGLILLLLTASIGLPFLLLSATGPLIQHWLSRAKPGASPYRLYSLSNAGSLLALLSYPIAVEPNVRLHAQAWIWSAGYLFYVLLCLSCAPWRNQRSAEVAPNLTQSERCMESSELPWTSQLFWVALAACGSANLLATTNLISQEVAVFPFLWVIPLCIYLTSFIICFESPRWYRREIFRPLFVLTAGAACILRFNFAMPFWPGLVVFSALLFVCCMICHGEIACTKPAPHHLTQFYLCIGAGGALGGAFVSLIAPVIFPDLWEFPLAVLTTGSLLLLVLPRNEQSRWHRQLAWMCIAVVSCILLVVRFVARGYHVEAPAYSSVWYNVLIVATALAAAGAYLGSQHRVGSAARWFSTRVAAALALALLGYGFFAEARVRSANVVARSRSFYGVVSVLRGLDAVAPYLVLRDRATEHGMQYKNPARAHQPLGYYGRGSGIGMLLGNHLPRPMRIGVVGLGVGSLAAYTQPGDSIRFYEINPDVVRFSAGNQAYFTFLRDCAGSVELELGDARVSLEREANSGQAQQFDVLVLDAFSGDAIPVHLLTLESFQVYLKHLRSDDSVIALHITNRSMDFGPVVAGIARQLHLNLVRIYRPWLRDAPWDWVMLSKNPNSLAIPEIVAAGRDIPITDDTPLWTDDFSNLFQLLN